MSNKNNLQRLQQSADSYHKNSNKGRNMTDKQPEALRLADMIERYNAGVMSQKIAEDYIDAAAELRRQHAELETLTLYKSLADAYGLSIFKDLKDLTTEIENLHEKLKTYEDLGDAGSDMQLLRMGYAAARLEIESLKARPAGAPQPSPAAQGDALDTMRLDWLDADESRCVFHLGKSWYTRPSYGLPYRKRASLREAIDASRAAQEGK